MQSEEDINLIFTELKKLGVKVPKSKKFKSSVAKQEKALPHSKKKIFGVSLCDQEWTADSDYLLPKFIASSITFLRDHINVEGIFRKAGSIARQRELRVKLENDYDLKGSEPNDVASLLKQWLRELPEPLIPNYLHDLYTRCHQLESSEDRINANLLTSLLLPQDHLFTLKYLLSFLGDVAAHSDKNKMDSRNVSVIMAPNVFVLAADSADKSSPDLVELHTCILELMIENASKIGEVPTTVQHCALDRKSCSELDSAPANSGFSPCKSRKKRKSGTVQDLFNGIKKLVGQSATPAATTAPRSASKRKAEHNDGSLPKKLTVEVNGERTSASETPKNKGNSKLANSDGKVHTRRKSFGLLRKKERKRQKSAQESPQGKMTLGVTSPFSWNVNGETNKTNNSLQVSDLPSPVSPFNLFGCDEALKCDSIKKSTSDIYLTVPTQRTFVLSVSSSQGELHDRPKASPYNLRTKFEGGQKSQMQSLESIQLEMKSIIGEHQNGKAKLASPDMSQHSGTDEVFEISTKTEFGDGICIKRDDPLRKSSCRRKAHRSQSHAAKNVLEDKIVKEGDFKNAGSCSTSTTTSVQLDARLCRRGMSRSSHKNGITRQEAFILKSKQKLKESLDQLESPEVSKPVQKVQGSKAMKDVKNHKIQQSQSVNLDKKSDIDVPGKKIRKTSRKASLIRGRPNTVKSGLRSDVCQRFSNDSILLPNENVVPLTSNNTKESQESPLHKNKIQVNEPLSMPCQETSLLEEKDASLYLKFKDFALSTPPGTSIQDGLMMEMHHNSSVSFSIFDDSLLKQSDPKLHLVVPSDAKQERKLSLPNPDGESSILSSKIPRLRRSLDTTRRISFPKTNIDSNNKITTPKTSNEISGFKIPMRCADSLKDLSALDFSMNDSCFKTPNRVASPDSVTWVSGSKYLGFNLPVEDEEATNKRESIAMILKSKPGHVQAKVHLWDTKVRDSVYCTRSVPSSSTPTSAFGFKEQLKNGKPLSVSKSCSSAYSTPNDPRRRQSKSQKKRMSIPKRKNQKLPLPPPPKFFVSESKTPIPNASQTLKEVNPGINESRNSLTDSSTKGPVTIKLFSSPEKDKLVLPENLRNEKVSSFLDHNICPTKEVTNTNSVMNESLNRSLNNDEIMPLENCKYGKRNSLLDNENRPLKEVTNMSSMINESKNSLNGSPTKDERVPLENHKKVKRLSFSNNQSHPLKEVTNISFGIEEFNNSLNSSPIKDVKSSKLPYHRKGKQSSFSGNTPKKLSKKISRSESSPCRPTTKILHHHQDHLLGSPLVATKNYSIPNRRLLRSSASKSGSCLSVERLRSDQMIDEWQCDM